MLFVRSSSRFAVRAFGGVGSGRWSAPRSASVSSARRFGSAPVPVRFLRDWRPSRLAFLLPRAGLAPESAPASLFGALALSPRSVVAVPALSSVRSAVSAGFSSRPRSVVAVSLSGFASAPSVRLPVGPVPVRLSAFVVFFSSRSSAARFLWRLRSLRRLFVPAVVAAASPLRWLACRAPSLAVGVWRSSSARLLWRRRLRLSRLAFPFSAGF